MTKLQKKWETITSLMKKIPYEVREKTKLHVLFDGHFTPNSGTRLARMFPMHMELELVWVTPTQLAVTGTCDIESHLETATVTGPLHIFHPDSKPVLQLELRDSQGVSTLTVAKWRRDFFSAGQLEGVFEGALSGDATLRLPSEQFLRILRLGR